MVNLPLFIAKRYLVDLKSNQLISLISLVSLIGVAVGTAALVIILSVFNGFEDLVLKMQNTFDPELKITALKGKTFPQKKVTEILHKQKEDLTYSLVLEEKALLRYHEKEYIVILKGVSQSYKKRITFDSLVAINENKILVSGNYLDVLENQENHQINSAALIGKYLRYKISTEGNSTFLRPRNNIQLYVPNSESKHLLTSSALKKSSITPVGIFTVRPDIDDKYIITSFDYLQNLLNKKGFSSSIEVEIYNDRNIERIQATLEEELGKEYLVQNRLQQNKFLYKMLHTEKLAVFLILIFVMFIATFNIIGLLTMSILSKKNDIRTLHNLGSQEKEIQHIFFLRSAITIAIGIFLGLILGLTLSYLQVYFGIVKMQGNFIIPTYPIAIHYQDLIFIIFITLIIGLLASWYPSKLLIKKLFNQA